ncbi:hypothetical protein GCM10023320_00390 [Pseudonocardia adelaidensis]|uniref:DUF305 domain-containing protein n=1 Tax=Pseudonocardia adelaidensis TaxID=648754 RepID=A0ABP9N6V4_9PSEU
MSTYIRAAVAGAALVLCGTLSACSSGAAPTAAPTTSEPPVSAPAAAGAQHNDTDVRFAQMMVPHHQQALAMTELALDRAESPEVKALAEQIRAAQDPEIATLNGFLENWGSPPVAGGMDHSGMDHSGGMTDRSEMDQLRGASGAAFDRMFLQMMIEHHEGAVAESEREWPRARTSRPRTSRRRSSVARPRRSSGCGSSWASALAVGAVPGVRGRVTTTDTRNARSTHRRARRRHALAAVPNT